MTALIVVFAIILFFAFLFFMPIVFYADFNEELKLSVRYAFVRIRLLPKKPEKKKKAQTGDGAKKSDKDEKAEKKDGSAEKLKEIFKKTGVGGLIEIITDLARIAADGAKGIVRHIVISKLIIEVYSAAEDAAAAAINYGYISAALYPSVSIIFNAVKKYKTARVQVFPDYDGKKTAAVCSARIKVKLWWVIVSGVKTLFGLLKKLIQLKKENII